MMKVVCKNNQKDVMDDEDDYELSIHQIIIEKYKGGGDHLILGKVYELNDVVYKDTFGISQETLCDFADVSDFENAKECYYFIENESGQTFWYSSNRFKTISENREEKLNELGI